MRVTQSPLTVEDRMLVVAVAALPRGATEGEVLYVARALFGVSLAEDPRDALSNLRYWGLLEAVPDNNGHWGSGWLRLSPRGRMVAAALRVAPLGGLPKEKAT